ncbi:amino acid racemase [bacterium]|nr:amino acid racemase [bacterium]
MILSFIHSAGALVKTLGIIGGVSWHSSAEYYRQLNLSITRLRGQRHSARVVLSSLNFADLLSWQRDPNTHQLQRGFLAEGEKLQAAGCDAFIIASHTLSWLGESIESKIGLKHISLYDALFAKLHSLGVRRVGLTGTRDTLSAPRYRDSYERAGFEVIIPDEPHFTRTATIVYKELVNGIFQEKSKEEFDQCIAHLVAKKADAVVLGCTEIGLLVREREWPSSASADAARVPLVDLIDTHVSACAAWMLQ